MEQRSVFDRPTASSEDSLNASTLLLSTSPSRLSRKRRSRTQVRWAKRVFVTTALLFLGVGVLLTTLGFVGLDLSPKLQLALRILGPVCLTVDLVTCLVCATVVHLWKEEWRRRRRATELRNRVLLHALTIDFLTDSSQLDAHLQNPKIRRNIIRQLRRRTSADVYSSTRSNSTKSLQDAVAGSIRRRSNVYSVAVSRSKIPKQEEEEEEEAEGRMRHPETFSGGGGGGGARLPVDRSPSLSSTVRLPGIQISRIDSFDVGCDDLPSKRSVCRSVLVESEISGEIYRISCSSEISLTTRSSRASSYSGSRVWDSEWDADVSIGSREDSQTSVGLRQDWAGGPADLYRQQAFLSPTGPRRTPTVVSFHVDPSAPRRHSSPTGCLKCNDCRSDAIYSKQNLLTVLKHKYPASVPRKYSFDQPRIQPTQALSVFGGGGGGGGGGAGKPMEEPDTASRSKASCASAKAKKWKELAGSSSKSGRNQSPGTPDALRCTRLILTADHHTDDSEIERRVNRLLYEIEHSVTDSVDESKIRSQDFEPIHAKISIHTQTS